MLGLGIISAKLRSTITQTKTFPIIKKQVFADYQVNIEPFLQNNRRTMTNEPDHTTEVYKDKNRLATDVPEIIIDHSKPPW